MNILLADDEKALLNFLYRGLKAEGFDCIKTNVLNDVLPLVTKYKPKVVILDRLFGNEDSLDTLVRIKAFPSPPMVLMLTALDDVSERIKGLKEGADDYLCKPFDFDELIARVIALSRRPAILTQVEDEKIEIGNLSLQTEQRIALLNGKELSLTKIEYELLLYLVENKNMVLSREKILSRVWETDSDPHTNIVDVYISRLRKQLESTPNICIKTLRGNGYRISLEEDVET